MEHVVHLVSWIHRAGAIGAFAFAGLAILASIAMVPATVIAMAAGFAFGALGGGALALGGLVLGSLVSFQASRTALGGWLARRAAVHPRIARVSDAVALRGFRVVLLLRLSPLVPHAPLSYVLGPTGMRWRDFLAATALGALPVVAAGAYVGSLVPTATRLARGDFPPVTTLHAVLWSLGAVATAIAAIVVTRLVQRAIATSVRDRGSHPVCLS